MTAYAESGPERAAQALDRQSVNTSRSSVTGMTLFVASEAVFFAAFFGVYAASYTDAKVWPPPGLTTPSILLPTIGVILLIVSGATMAVGVRRTHRADYPRGLTTWLTATTVLGVVFGVLVAEGLIELSFPIGQGIYETLFYMLLGLELAHVVGGVALLALVLLRAGTGELALRRDPVQSAAIYWFFVVVLGVVIYAVLYLASGG
ncbi:MAG TPA: cytochrome c oxidase subunit 3 [Nocardioidaceae bacterium]|nr:cytochrome c oxidase subunit 3 [Nocardioidaceae bacterium]